MNIIEYVIFFKSRLNEYITLNQRDNFMKSFVKYLFTASLFFILISSCKKESPEKESPETEQSKIIGNSIKIGNLEIAQNDFPYKLDWATATKSCSDLGQGWRLPFYADIETISNNLSRIPGIKINQGGYWLNEQSKAFEPSNQYIGFENKASPLYVRAVRSF